MLLLPVALPAVIGLIILVAVSATEPMGWILLMVSPALLWLLLLFAWPVTYDPGATRVRRRADPAGPRAAVSCATRSPSPRSARSSRSRVPLSSASWSYDRLEIDYRTPGAGSASS